MPLGVINSVLCKESVENWLICKDYLWLKNFFITDLQDQKAAYEAGNYSGDCAESGADGCFKCDHFEYKASYFYKPS